MLPDSVFMEETDFMLLFNDTASVSAKNEFAYFASRYPERSIMIDSYELEPNKYRVLKFWWGTVAGDENHSAISFMIMD